MLSGEGLSFLKKYILVGVCISTFLYVMPWLAARLPPTEPVMQED